MYFIFLAISVFVSACIGGTITWDTPENIALCIAAAILLGFAPQGIVATFGDDR